VILTVTLHTALAAPRPGGFDPEVHRRLRARVAVTPLPAPVGYGIETNQESETLLCP
jgi:hypothetical protein